MRYVVSVGGREIEVEVDGDRATVGGASHAAFLRVIPGTPTRQLVLDGQPTVLSMKSEGKGQWSLGLRGERWEVEVMDDRTRYIRSLAAGAGRGRGPAPLRAPMPGLVMRVLVEPGQEIAAGAGLIVLEAMKMENELKAPAGGVVEAVRVRAGEPVERGQLLVDFKDPAGPAE